MIIQINLELFVSNALRFNADILRFIWINQNNK